MSIRHFNRVLQTTAGAIVTGVTVTVTIAGTATLALLFDDAAGAVPKANPFVNNATYGTADFYVEEGTYDLDFDKDGYTFQDLNNWTIGAPLLRHTVVVSSINAAAILSATDAIPAGARVSGVFVTNTIAFGTGSGLTGYTIGDGSTIDLWGTNGVALNAVTGQSAFHSGNQPIYAAATAVVLSAIGGVFAATGEARIEVVYALDAAL